MYKKKLRLSRDPSDWVFVPEYGNTGWWRIIGSFAKTYSGTTNGAYLLLSRPDRNEILKIRTSECFPACTFRDFRDLEKTVDEFERYMNTNNRNG